MTANVDRVLQVAKNLSPTEQLELIQALSQSLLRQYQQPGEDTIPENVNRAKPVHDLSLLAADFWPDDESADDINDYLTQQRRDDRTNDL